MQSLVILGIVGFLAQLINSGLGMGYGVTSTTFLLLIGTSPALASATVNLSQVGSQFVSGFAHWRFGNVDWKVAPRIAVPGAIGAFVGALLLSRLSTEAAGPLMSTILLGLGVYLLLRFTVRGMPRGALGKPLRAGFLTPLGLVAGFMNSTGGGGWGPVGTTALLASGRLEPRRVIGSISVAEFAVVVAGSAGFALGLGLGGINFHWVLVMLLGGVLAAPAAAWLARAVPPRMLGALVGGLIILTNTRVLVDSAVLPVGPAGAYAVYGAVVLAWITAVGVSWRAHRLDREAERASEPEPAAR
ncbi:sulfite exporter TauE/SafE family protein [Allosalinactinospora lopnorensis]|uniref:sulfite exporter TauE/SafE family protein n=1 Tax=Allosalinactinospora lopnorensis TaxID=1352348 RepID=UPI000623BF7B|nr:sulfite exporter TauE/SafE family protein [Allosalinactinospora lopnorensis]